MDEIIAASPSRIVTVSSYGHCLGSGTINLEDPMQYSFFEAYFHSKLANVIFSRELGKRLQGL